jgi:sugar phosphate isomerase/epimerase
MHVCVLHSEWPPNGVAAASAKGVANAALPWEVVARHVSPHDLTAAGLRGALQGAGLELECVELPPLTCLDAATFERETDDTYMRLQVVERVGAPLAIIASGHEGEIGFNMMADAITRLAALAERMDVRLVVRNVSGSALERPESVLELLRRAGVPGLGVCFDAIAFSQALVNPADTVLAFAGRLAAVCVPARAVPILRVTEASIRATLNTLADEKYDGPVIVESGEVDYFFARFGELL